MLGARRLCRRREPAGPTFTGVWLNRPPWHEDDNIPLASGNQQSVLADMREMFTWKGAPVVVAYPETEAGSLSVIIRSHFYGAATVRHAAGIVCISGAGYSGIP